MSTTETSSTLLIGDEERRWLQAAVEDQFDLVRLLGRGAMGTVYLAFDRALQRWVAIKALLPEFAADPTRRERFKREALTNARLAHPNIVPIYAYGERNGVAFYVMRYINGPSLAFHLWRKEPLPAEQVCQILADLAGAVDYAHRQRVVHRDIKPENILLDSDTSRPMLTDFGIARAVSLDAMRPDEIKSERGLIYGTAHFLSPEQAVGEFEIDGRSDLYALGVIGYGLLSGTLPFEGVSLLEIASQHVKTPPPSLAARAPDAPRAVVDVIMRCLEKSPSDRWTDGRTFRDALIDAGLRPESLARRRGPWARIKRIFGR